MDKLIQVDKEEFERLVDENMFLEALEVCGVDNWEGYAEATALYKEWREDSKND